MSGTQLSAMQPDKWFSGNRTPNNDRLVLAHAPAIDDPEEIEHPQKNVWMGYWNEDSKEWSLLVPGYGSEYTAKKKEVKQWREIPVP